MISPDLHVTRPGGIAMGGALMVRELVLFTADLAAAPWYAGDGPPPEPGLPDGIALRWLPAGEWEADPAALGVAEDTARGRYRAGARCLMGWDAARGRCVYRLWASEQGARIEWIFAYVPALPGHLLVFDSWVHPDYRGRNVHWAAAARACGEARRRGLPGIVAGVEAHEFPAFAAKYAAQGLVLIRPHRALVGVRALGRAWHFARRPARRLAAFAEALEARHPALAGAPQS